MANETYASDYAPAAVTTFDFPPEIEYVIFEWAARMFPRDAAALSVLCKRIQPYVESIIYESLFITQFSNQIGSDIAAHSIIPTLMSRPSTFFAAHVRNLCMRPDVTLDIARNVLSKCTAIRHLALMLINYDLSPMVALSAHTLTSLNVPKYIAADLARCGIVFPNLSFLALQAWPYTLRVPPLEWVPSVKIVLVELGQDPLEEHPSAFWMEDIETVLSTAPQLRLLRLNVTNAALSKTKEYLRGRSIAKHIKIAFDNDILMEQEWRRLYRGNHQS